MISYKKKSTIKFYILLSSTNLIQSSEFIFSVVIFFKTVDDDYLPLKVIHFGNNWLCHLPLTFRGGFTKLVVHGN